ncbi:Sec-independent protein translocase protein TatB [Psychrobacter sp. TAE2020]|uniref:Sec-independent protein translocase protein TatB n=1 Tax=Psychrobacter sp. TAE2020 TaxID=2846762 RepID=UPI001C11BDC9|nr:Sec-independent protein translocase protein TatB [Psychrobacter sp. TAE2020]MBU5617324.1 Sec-independent protein translocase protein TatB [Psychrobacter sp. TAE2020]
MFDIGFSELFLFGVIALIVLGPEKLPQAARTAGKWYAKLRRTISTIQSEIEAELDLAETRQQMQDELANIRKTKADMDREMAEMRGSIKAFENSQNHSLKSQQSPMLSSATDSTQQPSGQNLPAEFAYAYESSATDAMGDKSAAAIENEPLTSDATVAKTTKPLIITRPWENMWFRLGDYDRVRRLPAAPYLPNYQADMLLYTAPAISTTLNSVDSVNSSVRLDKPDSLDNLKQADSSMNNSALDKQQAN